jgi:tRNA(Ser,Leu) C12 N-acetylase TAN1
MHEWNVIVTVYQDGYRFARRLLRQLGPVEETSYHNVLTMAVHDPFSLLEAVEKHAADEPRLYDTIARIAPISSSFLFESPQEFEDKAKAVVLGWLPRLANCSLHVRLHRRGFKHKLRSPDEERFLDDAILDALKEAGTPGSISFADPDVVIAIETIDNRAGMALWTREALTHHPLLRPD